MALHYNLAKVYKISDTDPDFVQKTVRLFLTEIPLELQTIKENIEEKNYDKVYTASHRIKPSLDLLGLDIAYDENNEIMKWAQAKGKKKEIIEVYKSVRNQVELAVKELKSNFKTL